MCSLQTAFCTPTLKHRRGTVTFSHLPWCCSDERVDLPCLPRLLCQPTLPHYYSGAGLPPAPQWYRFCRYLIVRPFCHRHTDLPAAQTTHALGFSSFLLSFFQRRCLPSLFYRPPHCLTVRNVYWESSKWPRSFVLAGFTLLQVQ